MDEAKGDITSAVKRGSSHRYIQAWLITFAYDV